MTEPAENSGGLPVVSVGLDEGTASRVMDVAAETNASRSHAAGAVASAGVAAMLNEAADSDAALSGAHVAMPDGTKPRLTPGLVETKALPDVARDLGADPRWLSALPQAQRRDMAARIARAASTLVGEDGTVGWPLVLSAARVMCRWSSPPCTVSIATRAEACRRVEGRIANLLPRVESGDGGSDPAADLAGLSAWRLAAEVTDVPGVAPEGPLALVAALLAPRPRGAVDEQTVQIRQEAGSKLSALLDIDVEEARAVGASAESAMRALRLVNDAAVRDAALALAGYAQRLSRPVGSEEADGRDKATLALSQRGAREIVNYASTHPRAKLAALEAAGHVSHSTLQRRLVQLEAAGVMCNAGSQVRPLWQVAGVERDPEAELTARQAKVLAFMRREPPAKTPEIASAIGTSTATVFATYRELEALGLAEKSGSRWVAVPRQADAGSAGTEDATAAAPDASAIAQALSRKGAPEVVAYATEHPRATRAELQGVAGISYETLRTRLRELAEAGVMENAGSTKEPLWQVRGVSRDDPEELLTEKQRGVLECLRRDPPPGTGAMAAELGMSRSMAGYVLQQLAGLGLVAKAPNNRWYAVKPGPADAGKANPDVDAKR